MAVGRNVQGDKGLTSYRIMAAGAYCIFAMGLLCSLPAVATSESDPRVQWVDEPVVLPEFTLTDDNGRSFRPENFRGRTALVFFGFTNCRDVCPATLQVLRQVWRSLGEDSAKLVNVFVSVDGVRDTPAVVQEYLQPFMPGFIGLTGDATDVRVLADELKAVFFRGMPTDTNGGYDVEHTSQVYLVDERGRLRATFYGASAASITAATQTILKERR
jgi:protein SCO1/2